MARNPRVVQIITGLTPNGAEVMLVKLLAALEGWHNNLMVASLMDSSREPLGRAIQEMSVRLDHFGVQPSRPNLFAGFKLRRVIREFRPDVVMGWEVHGNLAAAFCGHRPFLYNVRGSLDDLATEKPTTQALIHFLGRISSRAAGIVFNSRSSARQHATIGYREDRFHVIPNGFDCTVFRPLAATRAEMRAALRVPQDSFVVGHVARFHRVKDHGTALDAFARFAQGRPDVWLVLAGADVTEDNRELRTLVERCGVGARVRLLGRRSDIPQLLSAMDVAISSSHAEAFSNSIGEAMACGLPSVVTDVGDSTWIVGDSGIAVPPKKPEAFANALARLYDASGDQRLALGETARRRIQSEFSIGTIAARYAELYRNFAERAGR